MNATELRKAERAYRRVFDCPPSRREREKAFQAEVARLPVRRLVRRMAGGCFLDFVPPTLCKCGGKLEVRDYGAARSRCHASRDFRYETYCPKCNTCDPNGY